MTLDLLGFGAPSNVCVVSPEGHGFTYADLRRQCSAAPIEPISQLAIMPPPNPPTHGWLVRYLAALRNGQGVALFDTHMAQAGPGQGILLQTSGSTGANKQIWLSNENLSTNALAIGQRLALTPEDRLLLSLPLCYTFGLSVLHSGLISGAAICLPAGPTDGASSLLAAASLARATVLACVPPVAARLQHHIASIPDSVRLIQVAGGVLQPSTTRRLVEALPEHIQLWIMYGMTEATARISALNASTDRTKIGSVGKPLEGLEIAIEPVRDYPGDGVVVVRGASISTTARRTDGSLWTGDLGHIDPDGYLYLSGRVSNILKIGGIRYSLETIEAAFTDLEEVSECVAIALPGPDIGDMIGVAVVLAPDASADSNLLLQAVRNSLPRVLLPERVQIMSDLPRLPSGKTDRHAVIQLLGASP